MVRYLFLLHRYLGIAIGIIMVLWTVSGIIMMYKQYPELDRWESLALREPINLAGCCRLPVSPLTRAETFSALQVEMLNDEPVLRMHTLDRGLVSYNLTSGQAFDTVTVQNAAAIAGDFVNDRYPENGIIRSDTIVNDQWTVYSSYHPHRPLFRYQLDDRAGTEFYLSSRSGEIVQLTTTEQRVWGFLGAVIHWLYPTVLRQHTALWAQVVIWLTIIGIFLTGTGVYIGLRQYRKRNSGRLSPYRGMQLYHHYAGLIFGVFTLTWVASGLLSMNPWGLLEGEGIGPERQRLGETTLPWSAVEPVLDGLDDAVLPATTVMLEIFPQGDDVSVVAHTQSGDKVRLNPYSLTEDPLTREELLAMAQELQPQAALLETAILDEEDAYYFEHHEPREFPVYKVVLDDDQRRHYYLSAVDGRIQQKVDGNLRWYRWLFYGIHRGDFTTLTRSRPLWDLFMVPLLAGVTLICATGTWMGWRRLEFSRRTRRSRLTRASTAVSDIYSG